MKLDEILDPRSVGTNRRATTNTLIKLLRKKADRRNPPKSKTPKHGTWDPFGGMTGYPSFKGYSVDQAVWR